MTDKKILKDKESVSKNEQQLSTAIEVTLKTPILDTSKTSMLDSPKVPTLDNPKVPTSDNPITQIDSLESNLLTAIRRGSIKTPTVSTLETKDSTEISKDESVQNNETKNQPPIELKRSDSTSVVLPDGKNYFKIGYRICKFREKFTIEGGWSIDTQLIHFKGSSIVCKAFITSGAGRVLAVAHAEEVRHSSPINDTDPIENCETSAIGRCLSLVGYPGIELFSKKEKEQLEAVTKTLSIEQIKSFEKKMVLDSGVIKIGENMYTRIPLRISYFRANHKPEEGWGIITELIHIDNDCVVFSAKIVSPLQKIVASGHSEEQRRNFIAEGHALETCETSAIGRALAAAGFGGSEYASAEEVASANKQRKQ